jgi:hypothetical protein
MKHERCAVCRRRPMDLDISPICWVCYTSFKRWNFGRLDTPGNSIGWAAKRVWRLARKAK